MIMRSCKRTKPVWFSRSGSLFVAAKTTASLRIASPLFVRVRLGEQFAYLSLQPCNLNNPDPDRKRKLLLHRNEIRDLERKTQEKGDALVPIKIYFDRNSRVKIELAVARGKKLYDKRASMAERDSKREIERAMKERYR